MSPKANANPLPDRIARFHADLTPKSRIIGDFVKENPRKAIFMTVAELARACDVSEATVVRFVAQLGYDGYSDFQQSLRDFVDTEMTLLDRGALTDMLKPGSETAQADRRGGDRQPSAPLRTGRYRPDQPRGGLAP